MLRDKARFGKIYPINKGSILRPVIVASLGTFFSGKPENDQIIFYYVSTRKFEFKNNFLGSFFSVLIAPTSTQQLSIFMQNSSGHNHVANIVIESGKINGIFQTLPGANQHLNIGDSLYIKAPLIKDLTMSDLNISLAGDLIP
jgi:hypothetical protein